MREKLIQYVNLLFAGTDCEEVRDEILQNTLDRYDDLIAQGKAPEAAYRLAISGIGDISEILGSANPKSTEIPDETQEDTSENRLKNAVSIGMYILSPIPLFILSELGASTLGLCLTIVLVAAATVLRLTMKRTPPKEVTIREVPLTPRQELHKGINSMIWAVGLALYFIVSFATQAWFITWVIFPLIGATQGLVKAILDLKEANEHEN